MNPDSSNQQPQESGFCSQCGTSNARSAAFCAKCGALLPWAATKAEAIAPPAGAPVPPTPATLSAPPAATQTAPPTTPSGVPVLDGFKSLFKVLFPPELRAASKGATPQELLRLYGLRVAGLVLLALLVKSYAYSIVSALAVAAMVCLVVGLLNPQAFRGVFGEKTSKATVGWTLGIATLLLGAIGSTIDPKAVKSEPSATMTRPAGIASRVAPQPTGEKPQTGQVSLAQREMPKPEATDQSTASTAASALPIGSVSQAKRVAPPPAPPPASLERTAQQIIKEKMQSQFGDRLRQVKVSRVGKDIYDIKVEFNNKMRLTTGATKRYMEGDMKDAYQGIYTSGVHIAVAGIEAYGAGTDGYGNNVSSPAYETSLAGEVASKINWSNHRQARWESLWTVSFLHQQYREESEGRDWSKGLGKAGVGSTRAKTEMERLSRAADPNAPKAGFLGTHDLKASLFQSNTGISVVNNNAFAYRKVNVVLNDSGFFGGFYFQVPLIAPGERLEIAFKEFATKKDSRRFVPHETKLERVLLKCNTDYGTGVSTWKIN